MAKRTFHIVVLDPTYAKTHYNWLRDFAFESAVGNDTRYFFGCFSFELQDGPFYNFEISNKSGKKPSGAKNVLLPAYAIAGIFMDQKVKNPIGFNFNEHTE